MKDPVLEEFHTLVTAVTNFPAIIKRINRKLAKQGQALRIARGARMQMEVGEYFVVDLQGNFILQQHVDPVELGKEVGVLPDGKTATAITRLTKPGTAHYERVR